MLITTPQLSSVFAKYGFPNFTNTEFIKSLGSFLRFGTFLRYNNIDTKIFLCECNDILKAQPQIDTSDGSTISESTLFALLPCGLKNPLDQAISSFLQQKQIPRFNYLVEGNLNNELSYYPYINSITSIDELPEVIISSDLNSFYHHRFLDCFADKDAFISLNTEMNQRFESVGYADPLKTFTMFSANPLVIVHAKNSSSIVDTPQSWKMLFNDCYHKSIVMRGDNYFFCSGVLVPLYKMYGLDNVLHLASNVCSGLHPSQMVKLIDSSVKDIPPLYIMPLFFAQKIKNKERIEIIFPDEGALISPVQILIKKSAAEKMASIIDFLLGKELQQHCANNFFPSIHPDVTNSLPEKNPLYWVGWDFIYCNDIGQIKETLRIKFTAEFLRTGKRACV
jgi:ABC-type Fe3+ transport system substrate-binding protein